MNDDVRLDTGRSGDDDDDQASDDDDDWVAGCPGGAGQASTVSG